MVSTYLICKHLSIISTVLSLVPLRCHGVNVRSSFSVYYPIPVIFILIFINLVNIIYRIRVYYLSFSKTVIVDVILNSYLFLVCIILTVKSSVFHKDDWSQLNKTFSGLSVEKPLQHFLKLTFFIINIMYFVYALCQLILYSVSPPVIYYVVVPVEIDTYIILTTVLCYNNFANLFRYQMKYLREELVRAHEVIEEVTSQETNPYLILSTFGTTYGNINGTLDSFNKFCKGISAFNSIYGGQVVLISGVILCFITNHVTVLINLFMEDGWKDEYDQSLAIRILFIKFWNCCSFIVSYLLT